MNLFKRIFSPKTLPEPSQGLLDRLQAVEVALVDLQQHRAAYVIEVTDLLDKLVALEARNRQRLARAEPKPNGTDPEAREARLEAALRDRLNLRGRR